MALISWQELLLLFLVILPCGLVFYRALRWITSVKKPDQPQKEVITSTRETIKEIVKIRCRYCGKLYTEQKDKCPYCDGGR